MTEKLVEAFTTEDVEKWYDTALFNRPAAPASSAFVLAPEVKSYVCKSISTSTVVNFALDNGQSVVLKLNPVIVQMLVRDFFAGGQANNWMDSVGYITLPLVVER